METANDSFPVFTFVFARLGRQQTLVVRLVDFQMAIDYARGKLVDGHREKRWTSVVVAAGVGDLAKFLGSWDRAEDGSMTWTPGD
jgi:hypothetical protein